MAGQNILQILILNDANMIGELRTKKQEWKYCMDVLLRKSPFCPELTQILDLEETETHYGKSKLIKLIHNTSNEGILLRKIPCTGSKVSF